MLVPISLENRSIGMILRGVTVQDEQIWRSMTSASIVVVVLLLSSPWRAFSMDKSRQVGKHGSLVAVLQFITARSAVTAFCIVFLAMGRFLHCYSTIPTSL